MKNNINWLKEKVKELVKNRIIENDYDVVKRTLDEEEKIGNLKYEEIYQYLFDNPGERKIILSIKDSPESDDPVTLWFDGKNIEVTDSIEKHPVELEVNFPSGELIVGDGFKFFAYDSDNYSKFQRMKERSEIFAEQGVLHTYVGGLNKALIKNPDGSLNVGQFIDKKNQEEEIEARKSWGENVAYEIKDEIEYLMSTNSWVTMVDKAIYLELMEKNLKISKEESLKTLDIYINDGDCYITNIEPGRYHYINNFVVDLESNPNYLSMKRISDVTSPLIKKYMADYTTKKNILDLYLENKYEDIYPVFFKFLKSNIFNNEKKENYLGLVKVYDDKNKLNDKKMDDFCIIDNDIKSLLKEIPVFDFNVFMKDEFAKNLYVYQDTEYAPNLFDINKFLLSLPNESPVGYAFYGMVFIKTIIENSKELMNFKSKDSLDSTKKDLGKALIILGNIIRQENAFHYVAMLKNNFVNNYSLVNGLNPRIINNNSKFVESYKPFLDDQGISVEDQLKKMLSHKYGKNAFYELPRKNMKIKL